MSKYILGVDLGQRKDYSAFVLCEQQYLVTGTKTTLERLSRYQVRQEVKEKLETRYNVRLIERPALGTSYIDVANRAKAIVHKTQAHCVVDSTGVGLAVADIFDEVKIYPSKIYITGGTHVGMSDGVIKVPKRELISTAQILLQNGRIKIARKLELADTLAKELSNFKMKISTSGNEQYEAWREGDHDDIVLSLCMAVWHGEANKVSDRPIRSDMDPVEEEMLERALHSDLEDEVI